jgi:hypothetical protein
MTKREGHGKEIKRRLCPYIITMGTIKGGEYILMMKGGRKRRKEKFLV